MTARRILIISHAYAPGRNARAFRWSALAEHWASIGHKVDVLTAAVPGYPRFEMVAGVNVHRVGPGGMENIRKRFAPSSTPASAAGGSGGKVPAASYARRLLKAFHDLTWKKLYWPDYAALWILPATRAASVLLRNQPDTTLISVSIPFSSHVVGYLVRRRHPSNRWIMDIGDPFAFMVEAPINNLSLYGRLNFWAERLILAAADQVSVTTEGTLRRYLATYPVVHGKISEIPPLVNPPAALSAGSAPADGIKRLVYTGTLHRTIRGPTRLLRLFSRVAAMDDDIELHCYGNANEVVDVFDSLPGHVRRKIFLHGEVDRSAAVAAMASATALVNIGNDTTYQLPSKLVEYAVMGKPVINVVARQNDSSVGFFTRHPCVLNVIGDAADTDRLAREVLEFLSVTEGRACESDPDWLSRYSLANIVSSYERLFAPVE